jgi:uncharacterized membrane protein
MQRKTVTPSEPKKDVATREAKGEVLPPIEQSTKGLRRMLFEQAELVRQGKSDSARTNSMAKIANGVLDSIRVEMEWERHRERYKNPDGSLKDVPTPIQLDD